MLLAIDITLRSIKHSEKSLRLAKYCDSFRAVVKFGKPAATILALLKLVTKRMAAFKVGLASSATEDRVYKKKYNDFAWLTTAKKISEENLD